MRWHSIRTSQGHADSYNDPVRYPSVLDGVGPALARSDLPRGAARVTAVVAHYRTARYRAPARLQVFGVREHRWHRDRG